MAKHSDLPIYKPGCDLLSLVVDVQTQLPRMYKRSLGEKIHQQCMDALECMAVANALRGPGRVEQLDLLLTKLRSAEALLRVCNEKKLISHAHWARAFELLENVGAQAGGWRKQTLSTAAPAA